jgi:hypothetical protein
LIDDLHAVGHDLVSDQDINLVAVPAPDFQSLHPRNRSVDVASIFFGQSSRVNRPPQLECQNRDWVGQPLFLSPKELSPFQNWMYTAPFMFKIRIPASLTTSHQAVNLPQ